MRSLLLAIAASLGIVSVADAGPLLDLLRCRDCRVSCKIGCGIQLCAPPSSQRVTTRCYWSDEVSAPAIVATAPNNPPLIEPVVLTGSVGICPGGTCPTSPRRGLFGLRR